MRTEPEPAPFVFPSPRPARAGLARRVDLPEYLPARMLNEFVYCPRLFFYEWVEGVFAELKDDPDLLRPFDDVWRKTEPGR